MYPPGGNHYDATIDGALASEGLIPFLTPQTTKAPLERAIYTRRQLRGVIAGEKTTEPIPAPLMRRVWPDEPAFGFQADEMAFKMDGRLRIGGPTLKTYDLNDLSSTSRVRESLVQMSDAYRKLQASEDQLTQADMLNAVGCWESDAAATVGNMIVFDAELKTDARTYLWDGASTVQILRRGSYLVQYRTTATPDAGSLRSLLTAGSTNTRWTGTGLSTTLAICDLMFHEKTDDTAESVTITNSLGTSIGGSGIGRTILSIAKLR